MQRHRSRFELQLRYPFIYDNNSNIMTVRFGIEAQSNIYLSYLPTPPFGQDMTRCQFFKRSLTGLNSEFPFSETSCLTKAEEPSLSYHLPIARGRIIGVIPFPRVLVVCEMQSVSSRIWTRVAVSISYDDNHYTTGTSNIYLLVFWVWHKSAFKSEARILEFLGV